jgi:hypothetical protein
MIKWESISKEKLSGAIDSSNELIQRDGEAEESTPLAVEARLTDLLEGESIDDVEMEMELDYDIKTLFREARSR